MKTLTLDAIEIIKIHTALGMRINNNNKIIAAHPDLADNFNRDTEEIKALIKVIINQAGMEYLR